MTTTQPTQDDIAALQTELQSRLEGEVRFDETTRLLYATDASIYQIEPLGVVLPRDQADVAEVLRFARRHAAYPGDPRGRSRLPLPL